MSAAEPAELYQEDLGLLVIELSWEEHGVPRAATFGVWQIKEDDSHLAPIREFMAGWQRVTGLKPQRAVMSVVFDPEQWVRNREAQEAST